MYRIQEIDADVFHARLSAAREQNPDIARHTVLLNRSTYAELYKCYMVQDSVIRPGAPMGHVTNTTLNAGFAIECGDKRRLRCMFNATVPHVKLGDFMVQEAVRLGARSLNCPDDWRARLYAKYGFRKTHKLVYMSLGGPDE